MDTVDDQLYRNVDVALINNSEKNSGKDKLIKDIKDNQRQKEAAHNAEI